MIFFENLLRSYLSLRSFGSSWDVLYLRWKSFFSTGSLSLNRHFSHVTKSCNFENFDLRRKADRNFLDNCWKTTLIIQFHLKLYSYSTIWLARSYFHMGTSRKTNGLSSYFWQGQPFRFCYQFCNQKRLKSTKTSVSY